MFPPDSFTATGEVLVSTGRLPDPDRVRLALDEAHAMFRPLREGEVSQAYSPLARMPADLFGLCIADPDGGFHAAGDADHAFTIMSVSKPFVFALVCGVVGASAARTRLGANATGRPFNSAAALEAAPDGLTNPMVNTGAIATTSLVPGGSVEERWRFLHDGLCGFAGRNLALNGEVYAAAMETNARNRGLAWLLASHGRLGCDPMQALDLYSRQCALEVTARDLAAMGATLACGGRNPLSGRQVVAVDVCHPTLAVMLTAGLYETSGDWLYEVGLPGKSGIAGGLVAVVPGKGGLGLFSPPLDATGNSVRGQLAARHLSRRLALDLLASLPDP